MKEELCKAFCEDLRVQAVPAGLAVSTRTWTVAGDPLVFYLIGPSQDGWWYVQDDGTTMAYLEAIGADIDLRSRADVFHLLLVEYGAEYIEETGEIRSIACKNSALSQVALRFVALLLRVQDLFFLVRERVEQTWTQEVERVLAVALEGKATIRKNAPLHATLKEYPADIAIFSVEDRPPVGLFFGTSDIRSMEALLLRSKAFGELAKDYPVILMLEQEGTIAKKQMARADANLIVPRYRGTEVEAIGRVFETVTGRLYRPEQVH